MVSMLLFTGCLSYHIAKPVYPKNGNPNKTPHRITSLQPQLSWVPSGETGVTYDLVIHEGTVDQSFWKGVKRILGDQVYYRENITGNSHKVEMPLKPDTEYYWALRVRRGDEKSQWSKYDYTLFLGLTYMKVSDAYFRFKTPK
jgi:hypothetical protein